MVIVLSSFGYGWVGRKGRRRVGNRGGLYRLRSHRGLVVLRCARSRHRRGHARGIRVRRNERRASSVRLGAVRVAARRRLRLERGRHRVPALVAVSERRLGRVPSRGVVWVVRGVAWVEPTSTTSVVEAAPVRTGHSLVAHVTGARHGYIRPLAVVERLVLEGVRRKRLAHVALVKALVSGSALRWPGGRNHGG